MWLRAGATRPQPGSSNRPSFPSALVCGTGAVLGLLIERVLKQLGVETIYHARSGEEALSCALRSHPPLVITEVDLPRMDGIELNDRLAHAYRPCTLILYDLIDELSENHSAACACIEKPFSEPDLASVIRRAFERCQEKQ